MMKHNQMNNEMQQTRNIKDVFTENEHHVLNLKTHRMKSSIAPTCETEKGRAIERNSTPNIFLAQNKGKGPPGRQRSPVEAKPNRFRKPVRFDQTNDIISDPYSLPSNFGLRNSHPNDFEIATDKKNDDYKFYKFNFFQLLNSITMKKQLFILILAVFASVTVAFGQKAVHNSSPFIPATPCMTDDALHPIAGKKYNYQAVVNPTGGNFTWWATQDKDFITNQTTNNLSTKLAVGPTSPILAAGASYGNTTTTDNVDITWSSALLSTTSYKGAVAGKNPTFVVVQYDAPAAGCANNLKVWELDPKNGFTVDILNLNNTSFAPAAYGAKESQCIDKVSKAQYSGGNILYEFGKNILYYEVIAANFSESWKPTIAVTLPSTSQTYILEWTYDKNFATATWNTYTPGTTIFETDATDTSNGVSVYLRMTITNNQFENNATAHPTGSDVTLALDGQNKENQWDIKNSDCTDPNAADTDDKAIQTLMPRPEVKEGTSSTQATNKTMIPSSPAIVP